MGLRKKLKMLEFIPIEWYITLYFIFKVKTTKIPLLTHLLPSLLIVKPSQIFIQMILCQD